MFRNVAVRIAEGSVQQVKIGADDLAAILGPRKFEAEVAMRTGVPGVATGLAWTPVGGDILFIEATRMPGAGKLILTGQLGDVMKESAQAALSLVKARSQQLGIAPEVLEKSDIHVHVPAGATPKDGPSAGVAMFVALASLLTGRPVRSDVAMTGEISLRGLVLPIGGVKEKVLAALRAGITTVMLPARNRRDLEEIPADAREKLNIRVGRAGRRRGRSGAVAGTARARVGIGRRRRCCPGSRRRRGRLHAGWCSHCRAGAVPTRAYAAAGGSATSQRRNQSVAAAATCSSVPGSSNRCVAPGTMCSDFSHARRA